jgi:hypothetical protein
VGEPEAFNVAPEGRRRADRDLVTRLLERARDGHERVQMADGRLNGE